MKRLQQYNGGMRSSIYKYLIETPHCFDEALAEMAEDYGIRTDVKAYGLDDKPKDYPYIALMHPDDEYSRIDYVFVVIADFTDNSEEGTLSTLLNSLYNDTTMKPWIDRIVEAMNDGDKEVEFTDLDDAANPDNERSVNDHQIEYIRTKGYKVTWEKYPRSYVVSGW